MKARHILIPALLILLAPGAASALIPAWKAAQSPAVEESTGNIMRVATYSKWFYRCNVRIGMTASAATKCTA
jgi:hypothetical protein